MGDRPLGGSHPPGGRAVRGAASLPLRLAGAALQGVWLGGCAGQPASGADGPAAADP